MERKFDLINDPEALFRFLLVSRVWREVEAGGKVSQAVRRVAGEVHLTFEGKARRVGERTLYRWLAAFEAEGLAGLVPQARERREASTVLAERLLLFAKKEKEDDPRASVPEILRRARELGIVGEGSRIDRTTLYRSLRRMGVETKRRRSSAGGDQRRFAWPHRMQMMLSDGKHFRAGAGRLRRVALFFLDDATRMGLEVVVGTSEDTVLFLEGLFLVVRRWGRADMLYLDRGPGFISQDTAAVVANLNTRLILGRKAYPEGHGAIERFNQSAKQDVLRHLDGRPDVDPDPGVLTLRLRHWLWTAYNRRPHEFLDGATPEQRFLADDRPVQLPRSEEDLRSRFLVTEWRTVGKDHVVPLDGVGYETPAGYAGARLRLYRHALEGTVCLLHEGRLIRLHPVDTADNARSRRARRVRELPPAGPTRGAADIAFDTDFGPVVGPDGGFPDPPDKEKEE